MTTALSLLIMVTFGVLLSIPIMALIIVLGEL